MQEIEENEWWMHGSKQVRKRIAIYIQQNNLGNTINTLSILLSDAVVAGVDNDGYVGRTIGCCKKSIMRSWNRTDEHYTGYWGEPRRQ